MATFAVIQADPNSTALGEVLSTHRTAANAHRALRRLDNPRWAYVAERRADGSYPRRVEAMDLPAMTQGLEDELQREHASR